MANRYPHEFSGGQRQRVCIARALARGAGNSSSPTKAVSALDVSIKAQVVNLLLELARRALRLSYLFISHDMAVVERVSHRVAVMYLGEIVEIGNRADIFADPQHPYTRKLLSAVPVADPAVEATRRRIILKGDIPDPSNPPAGCRFCTRCPEAVNQCFVDEPAWREVEPGRYVACHLVE
jgi:oligopeptide transport system ATP-binding protein